MLLFVVIAALFVAFFVWITGSRDKPSNRAPPPEPSSSGTTKAQTQTATPPRFDQESATRLHRKRILTGRAWVTDGDTITIKNTQIRLFGIDAPELNHPYGKKAKWALHKLCKGHKVRAEVIDEDIHGRTVAICYLSDGRDLSAEMVKLGLALDWSKFSRGQYRSMETSDARRRLFLADARQKGRMDVWRKFEERQRR